MIGAAQATVGTTQPSRVPRNNWTVLAPPPLGSWQPTEPITVVIPAYQCQTELDLTLTGLACQTYPEHLLQVVVVDDGSSPPLEARSGGSLDVQVVRLERSGFGAGRARNKGAEAADGDVLLFLDADIVAAPVHVEAHARWHHAVPYAATMGYRRFVDFAGVTGDALHEALASDGMDALLAGRDQRPHEWIERFIDKTSDLTVDRDDLFRIVVGASLGVRADLFAETKGFTPFGLRGIEDVELGFRLWTAGAVLIPDRQASSWHQGPRFFDGAAAASAKRRRAARLADFVPVGTFRPSSWGRSYAVPRVAAAVPVDNASVETAVRCVNGLLTSLVHDLVVVLEDFNTHPERSLLLEHFEHDPRVTLAGADAEALAWCPVRLTVPPTALLPPEAIPRLLQALDEHHVGALHVTVPGTPVERGLLEVVRTRAVARSRRVASPKEDLRPLIGELFGERWEDGADYGVSAASGRPARQEQPPAALRYAGMDNAELQRQLQAAQEDLDRLRQQRLVQLAARLRQLPVVGRLVSMAARAVDRWIPRPKV